MVGHAKRAQFHAQSTTMTLTKTTDLSACCSSVISSTVLSFLDLLLALLSAIWIRGNIGTNTFACGVVVDTRTALESVACKPVRRNCSKKYNSTVIVTYNHKGLLFLPRWRILSSLSWCRCRGAGAGRLGQRGVPSWILTKR